MTAAKDKARQDLAEAMVDLNNALDSYEREKFWKRLGSAVATIAIAGVVVFGSSQGWPFEGLVGLSMLFGAACALTFNQFFSG